MTQSAEHPRFSLGLLALAVASQVHLTARPSGTGKAVCGGPRSVQESRFLRDQQLLHEQLFAEEGQADGLGKAPQLRRRTQRARFGRSAPIPPAAARDIGEIAVIEANPKILVAPRLNDLSGRTVTIIPGPQGFEVRAERHGSTIDSSGLVLSLEDDDAVPIELPFDFPFYGLSHRSAFVHSDGFVTFQSQEASSTERLIARAINGPPWISLLFQDLNPSQGGRVTVQLHGDRAVVTWFEVPSFCDHCIGDPRTARATLHSDGRIEFQYGDRRLGEAVVGIFPGDPAAQLQPVNWSAPRQTPFDSGLALAEVFTSQFRIDEFAVMKEFFRTHQDAYDTVIFFNDLNLPAGSGAQAYSAFVRNEVRGTGLETEDIGEQVGSARRLSTFINMGSVREYPAEPTRRLREGTPDFYTPLNVLAHEIGHRFLAFASFLDPETGERSNALLGRQLAHWSFFFNSDASLLEGNKIEDLGPQAEPRFKTVEASARFSKLDQYLMGLVEPSEVPATFLVVPEGPTNGGEGSPPMEGLLLHGSRKDIRLDDIIAADGARRPDTSVSQRHFRYGFVLLVKDIDGVDPRVVEQLERLRSAWLTFFETQFDNRASAAADLVKMLHLSTWPAGGVIVGADGNARVTIAEPREMGLVVDLHLGEAIAEVPPTVTIPAGERHANFVIKGLDQGAATLVAEAQEPGFDRAVTRLAVRTGLEGLELERMHPPRLHGLPGQLVPVAVKYLVRDENLVPYSAVDLEFIADGGRHVASATSDIHGEVAVEWPLGAAAGQQLLTARLKGAPAVSSVTEASVAPSRPVIEAGGIVNAASLAVASPGKGLALGSLAKVRGSALSSEQVTANPVSFPDNPSLPYELGGTRVHVMGIPAPMASVRPEELTFQVPLGIENPTISLMVTTPFGRSDTVLVPVSAVQPGIFPDGVRAAQPGAVPRAGGSLIVRCTGLGATDPAGRTGIVGDREDNQRVRAEMEAWIDGQAVQVTSSILSPSEVGVYLVTLDLPSQLAAGTHEVRIAADRHVSNTVQFRSE